MTQYLDEDLLNKDDAVSLERHETYLKRSKELFGEQFIYDGVIFGATRDFITLRCVDHGEFSVMLKNHFKTTYGGCGKCYEKGFVESYIARAKEKHGDKFSYEDVKEIKTNGKVTIKCNKHGKFTITHIQHLESKTGGCPICRADLGKAKINERVRTKFVAIHGDQFDYGKADLSSPSKVTITCKDHGKFKVKVNVHRNSEYGGCTGCNKVGEGKKNAQKFITRSQEKFGDQYDYSKVESIHIGTVITITCKKHSEFKINYIRHIESSNGGCPECRKERHSNSKQQHFEKFKAESIAKHGDKFSYEKVDYSATRAVIITCKAHGDFKIRAYGHLESETGGCAKCIAENQYNALHERFVKIATEKHGDNFDYSNTVHKPRSEYVLVRCKKHGEFRVNKHSHISLDCGGCVGCREDNANHQRVKRFKLNAQKKHGSRFTYNEVKASDIDTQITVSCVEHGRFRTTKRQHIRYEHGDCVKCLEEMKRKRRQEQYIKLLKDIHGEAFNYDKSHFVNYQTPFNVVCVKHGEFTIVPYQHQKAKFGGCAGCKAEDHTDQRTHEILSKLQDVHKGKYTYPDFKATRLNDVLVAACPEHGDFEMTVKYHLQGLGCATCSIEARKNQKLKTFIAEAEEKYGKEHHDYSLIERYINRITPLPIRCKKHNLVFNQTPVLHLNSSGCPECKIEVRLSDFEKEQMQALKEHLGDSYDLSESRYNGYEKFIAVKCKKHGVFERQYNALINAKIGCFKCANEDRKAKALENFVEKAKEVHGDRYDYSETVVVKGIVPVKVRCKQHGLFSIYIHSHLKGANCPHCVLENQYIRLKNDWIKEFKIVHGDKYVYAKLPETIRVRNTITVGCKIHGDFETKPRTHLKSGCPKCSHLQKLTIKCIRLLGQKFKGKYTLKMPQLIEKTRSPAIFICTKHGEFESSYHNVRRSKNSICPTCSAGDMNTEILRQKIEEKFGDKILTGMIYYTGMDKVIKMQCRKHTEFSTTPRKALRKYFDCPKCIKENEEK